MKPVQHEALLAWVDEIAALTRPESVIWYEGSDAEWARVSAELVAAGTLVPLDPAKRLNSGYAGDKAGHLNAAVFLLWEKEGWRPGAASNRIQLDRQLLARLTRQLPLAIGVISSIADRRFAQLADAVTAAMNDSALLAILDRCRLDLAQFFGTVEAARMAIASASDEPRRGMTAIRMTNAAIGGQS